MLFHQSKKQQKQQLQQNDVQKLIKKQWKPQHNHAFIENRKLVVQLKIGKDGKLIEYKIIKSSGDAKLDITSLKALKNVENFGKFPFGAKDDTIDIQFTFDYNMFRR